MTTGFQRLIAEVTLNHVGMVLGLEMSRLARSSKDWHAFFEMCAVFGTLIADEDGVYEANDPNDRLVLGLKGIISEMELHTMHNRLYQGLRNKARRGELFTVVPIGYVRLPSEKLVLDPDEQVRSVVHLIFEKFEELGSASAVLKYLVRHGIRLGVRRCNGRVASPVEWTRPSYSTLLSLLHNPTHAGAYCRGRRTSDPRRKTPLRRGQMRLPMQHWEILLRDAVPAYITWDQYLANVETLKSNHARMARLGAARNGPALLPGLLVCGYCGARMVVQYMKNSGNRYACLRQAVGFGGEPCQNVKGNLLEDLVREKVLQVLEPAALELSLQAGEDIQRERDRLHKHWQQRAERTRYEADRARRQYDAVEPENRLVARTLEQHWEVALRDQQKLEEDYRRFCLDQPPEISPDEKAQIHSLASEVPKIWMASQTSAQDRKTIVRHLIERVVVRRNADSCGVTIHWAGGYASEHEVVQPVGSFNRMRDFERFKKRVLELHFQGRSYSQICAQLAKEKFQSPTGLDGFQANNLRTFVVRYCHEDLGPNAGSYREFVGPNEWLVNDLSREINTPQATLQYWRKRGWVHARALRADTGRWIFWADTDEVERLKKLRTCPMNMKARSDRYPMHLVTPKPRPQP